MVLPESLGVKMSIWLTSLLMLNWEAKPAKAVAAGVGLLRQVASL